MDSKSYKYNILSGSIARRVFFRALFIASAISIVSLIRVLPNIDLNSLIPKTYDDFCIAGSESHSQNASLTPGSYLFQSRVLNTFWGSFDSMNCQKDSNFTFNIIKVLMGKGILNCEAKSLCIGEKSLIDVSQMQRLGFSSVMGHRHKTFSLNKKKIVYELQYQDCSFDFVLSKDLDKVSVPSLLVLEVERILKPGGIGALLMDPNASSFSSFSNNLNELKIFATPVSSLLRSSIVHVGFVNELSLVVFKKRSEIENTNSSFYHYSLPEECAKVASTKPLIELMEPLVEEDKYPPLDYEKRISYLPKFVTVSNKKRLVYIGVANKNIAEWFPPSYPIDKKTFNVYFVHYNSSILLSHVKQPRITFVYHPGLAGNNIKEKRSVNEDVEEFDFLVWFKETVKSADFVVLKMNAGEVEMKFLVDIFQSGAICFVDELFLSCSDSEGSMNSKKQCMDVYKSLRKSGVYVHQWWDDKLHQGNHVSYVR